LQASFSLALPDVWAALQQTLTDGEGGGGGGGAGGEDGARQLCLVTVGRLVGSASLGGRAPPSGQPGSLLRAVASLVRPPGQA